MIILASEEISRRNRLPVKIKYVAGGDAREKFLWAVECCAALNGECFNTFEEVTEFIKQKKLLSPKQLEKIENIKNRLLKSAEYKLEELRRIEDIRDTAEYRKAAEIAEIAERLIQDRKAQTIVQALKLLEIASLQEFTGELAGIANSLDSIDATLTAE